MKQGMNNVTVIGSAKKLPYPGPVANGQKDYIFPWLFRREASHEGNPYGNSPP